MSTSESVTRLGALVNRLDADRAAVAADNAVRAVREALAYGLLLSPKLSSKYQNDCAVHNLYKALCNPLLAGHSFHVNFEFDNGESVMCVVENAMVKLQSPTAEHSYWETEPLFPQDAMYRLRNLNYYGRCKK